MAKKSSLILNSIQLNQSTRFEDNVDTTLIDYTVQQMTDLSREGIFPQKSFRIRKYFIVIKC